MILAGDKIREARKELRITQDTLADQLKRRGVDCQVFYISNWERGKQPSQPVLIAEKLALIFHKPKGYFLAEDKPKGGNDESPN